MVLTKRFLILTTCILIIFVSNLNSQPSNQEGKKIPLKQYLEKLKKLATTDANDKQKFIDIIKNTTGLDDYGTEWGSYGTLAGEYIGEITINNLDEPQNLRDIGGYVKILTGILLKKDYVTVAKNLFNKFATNLDTDNAIKKLKVCGIIKSDLNPIAQSEKRKSVVSLKINKLCGNLQKFPIKTKSAVVVQNGSNDWNTTVEKLREVFVEKNKNYLERDTHFVIKHLELLITILFALFLFSILLGLVALFLKSKTKVKRPGIDMMQSRIDKLRNGKTLEEVKKEEERLARKEESSSFQGTGKKEEDVDIQKGFEILLDGIILFGTSIEGRLLPKDSEVDLDEINDRILKLQKSVSSLDETIKSEMEADMAVVAQELKLKISEETLKKIGKFFEGIQPIHLGAVPAGLSSNQIENKLVEAERGILKRIWDTIPSPDEREELKKLGTEIYEKEEFFRHCVQLESQININEKLSRYYRNIFEPLRNYKKKIIEILHTEQMVAVENKEDKKSDTSNRGNDIVEIKHKVSLLLLLQNTNEVPGLLAFKLDHWIKMEFLKFADQFLKIFQQDEYQEKLVPEMETVRSTILGILSCFDIEPYPIILGETDFDSQIHKSESSITEPSMRDKVISDVVRNGFRNMDGKVIVVPEVIVNRHKDQW
jgi:GrpE